MRTKPTLVATNRMPDAVHERLAQDYNVQLNMSNASYSKEDLLELAQNADGIITSLGYVYDAEFLSVLPDRIKIIATVSVGYEHIDVAAARAQNIIVTNTPDVLTDATADIALLLLLGAARRAGEGHMMVMKDEWPGWTLEFMLGKDVTGARLGILGMGRIGRALAKRARGLDMQIHYHNRQKLPADLEQDATYHDTLESLLSVSDFLSLNATVTPQTKAIINRTTLSKLPKGAVVINTARGDLIDDQALIDALRSGHLSAAGLDVFAGEPNIHPGYRELKNVFLLPHLGSATKETRDAMGFRALDNLDAFFRGKPPRDVVS